MTITLYYFTRNTIDDLESEVSFESFSEFKEWFQGNVEYSIDNNTYDGRPCGLHIYLGNYVFEKSFDSDITWDELWTMMLEMEAFFA